MKAKLACTVVLATGASLAAAEPADVYDMCGNFDKTFIEEA